jgi:Arc/MetJ-type ribon-helix-helix transcriptional regulator
MTESVAPLRPSEFARKLLRALEASEGRRKRRKRDQTPDQIGLGVRRELLEQAAVENPEPDEFEAWLLQRALTSPASGPVRAMAVMILDEYRSALHDPSFRGWLDVGAPSEDAAASAAHPEAEMDRRVMTRLRAEGFD